MTTPYQDCAAAAKALMTTVSTLSQAAGQPAVTQAPTNWGRDFRIAAGTVVYQLQLRAASPVRRSNSDYPRANVSLPLYAALAARAGTAAEEGIAHVVVQYAADVLLDRETWRAEAGIYELDRDNPPEISDGERVGNVLIFTVEATVVMNPV